MSPPGGGRGGGVFLPGVGGGGCSCRGSAMRQRKLGSHTPPCHRRMLITTLFSVLLAALQRRPVLYHTRWLLAVHWHWSSGGRGGGGGCSCRGSWGGGGGCSCWGRGRKHIQQHRSQRTKHQDNSTIHLWQPNVSECCWRHHRRQESQSSTRQ